MTEVLLTADQAAAEVKVAAGTIYAWVSRGYLAPVDKQGRYKVFRLSDVLNCEASRKREHRRRSKP